MKTIIALLLALVAGALVVDVQPTGPPGAREEFDEAISRSFTVFNRVADPIVFNEAVSRGFTVLNRKANPVVFDEAVSRSITVLNRIANPIVFAEGISRSFTVCNSPRENGCECGGQEKLKVRCRDKQGQFDVTAKIKLGVPGATLTFRFDGGARRDRKRTVRQNGKAKVTFSNVTQARHTVEVIECALEKSRRCRP